MCFMIDFLEARDLVRLRALRPLNDVELDLIALFEALVALALDRTVVDEDVRPAFAAEEAVALCVVEPLYGAFILCQWSKLPFFAFVGADCIPRSESASTIASLKACDAKGAKGVFWRLYRMSLFCNRADLWLVTCSMAFYTVEIATLFRIPNAPF